MEVIYLANSASCKRPFWDGEWVSENVTHKLERPEKRLEDGLPGRTWLITMVIVGTSTNWGNVGPLPRGRTPWLINGGY